MKIGPHAKATAFNLQNSQIGSKIKIQKTCKKLFFNHIRVVLCGKPLEKTPNIRQMRRFSKSAIMQRL